MNNNIFSIVFRESDHRKVIPNLQQDRWGWERADEIDYTDYQEVSRMMMEYQTAMPKFTVRIRATPIS